MSADANATGCDWFSADRFRPLRCVNCGKLRDTHIANTASTPSHDSYVEAFYEIARTLGIEGPQPISPKRVHEEQVMPRLRSLLSIAAAPPPPVADGREEVGGWIVTSGDGLRYRTWLDGMSAWTDERSEATRYHRRADAEAVHAEDEDAWCVIPYATPPQPASPPGGLVAELLADTGCQSIDELRDMANVGSSLMAAIAVVTKDGPYKGWLPAEDPAEIVGDLINDLAEARAEIAGYSNALYAAHYFIDAHDEQLVEQGITREYALLIARKLRDALSPAKKEG